MKTKTAIFVLEEQKIKFFKSNYLPIVWLDETLNYIEQIFGKDSNQYSQINDLEFKENYPKTGIQIKLIVNNVKIKD